MIKQWKRARAGDEGFTLIELLVAIVVVAILAVVAIVGVDGLTNNGKKSACKATMDAAKAASVVYYTNTGAYPTTFTAMTGTTPPVFDGNGATVTDSTVSGNGGWTLTISGGGSTTAPTFSGCPA